MTSSIGDQTMTEEPVPGSDPVDRPDWSSPLLKRLNATHHIGGTPAEASDTNFLSHAAPS
jgi:hypothetical protein